MNTEGQRTVALVPSQENVRSGFGILVAETILEATLTEPENRRTEKLEFSLPKTCFQFGKALAQNRARKPLFCASAFRN